MSSVLLVNQKHGGSPVYFNCVAWFMNKLWLSTKRMKWTLIKWTMHLIKIKKPSFNPAFCCLVSKVFGESFNFIVCVCACILLDAFLIVCNQSGQATSVDVFKRVFITRTNECTGCSRDSRYSFLFIPLLLSLFSFITQRGQMPFPILHNEVRNEAPGPFLSRTNTITLEMVD